MYHIKLNSYIPKPEPANSDRIIAAHYYAAWKKGAAGIHDGFDDLAHEYPDRTPLMGYYDEENPQVCDWEIKWAVEHGINCFIYCWYLSPEKYKELLKRLKEITDSLPEDAWARKIMMIDNWNEWDEGHFVAPSHTFGYKYLQAIREALTECNNLPDYITPHDQGFGGYNQSWKTPDFSEFCEKQLQNIE